MNLKINRQKSIFQLLLDAPENSAYVFSTVMTDCTQHTFQSHLATKKFYAILRIGIRVWDLACVVMAYTTAFIGMWIYSSDTAHFSIAEGRIMSHGSGISWPMCTFQSHQQSAILPCLILVVLYEANFDMLQFMTGCIIPVKAYPPSDHHHKSATDAQSPSLLWTPYFICFSCKHDVCDYDSMAAALQIVIYQDTLHLDINGSSCYAFRNIWIYAAFGMCMPPVKCVECEAPCQLSIGGR